MEKNSVEEMPLTFSNFDEANNDATVEQESSGSSGYRQVVLQQSVTMLAYMDRTTQNTTFPAGISEPRMLLGFSIHDLPILIGAVVGAAGLILIILAAVVIWHCCRFRGRHDKAYCLDNSTPEEGSIKQGSGSIVHSDSVVFLGTKSSQVSTRTLGIKADACQSALTRSQSVPLKETNEQPPVIQEMDKPVSKKRPMSQPVQMTGQFPLLTHSPKRAQSSHMHHYHHINHSSDRTDNYATLALPSIPEVVFRSSESLQDIPPLSQCISCNALDEPCLYSSLYSTIDPNTAMKTRSLPSWGRSRSRPLSTEDDLNELYAKVSFSKKRKNRMRNDSAAAIAVNKSRSTFLTIPFSHKDTDSLVDNEAVVVYDERTAL